jgi:hypothetical protein
MREAAKARKDVKQHWKIQTTQKSLKRQRGKQRGTESGEGESR